jgi:glycosyltransferase involved in cell wall biosynthesis
MTSVDVIQAVCDADTPGYLGESINSILAQTRQVHEYIIVRDGSLNRELEAILEQYRDRITLIENHGRKGLAGCLNCAIRHSSAQILVRMDSDDISKPHRVDILARHFQTDKKLLVLGSGAEEVDDNGNVFFVKAMPKTTGKIVQMAMTRPPFIHVSVAFKREFFQTVGLYDETYLKAQDYDLWARTIVHHPDLLGRMKNIDTPLINVRLPEDFWSKRSFSNIRYGTPISLRLIRHFGAYHRLVPLTLKIFMRLSPAPIKRFSYKYLRN